MLWINLIGGAMLLAAAVLHLRARRRQRQAAPDRVPSPALLAGARPQARGPTPGYERYAGTWVDEEAITSAASSAHGAPLATPWRAVSFERFDAPDRRRAVLRVELAAADPHDELRAFLSLAAALASLDGAGAAIVERANGPLVGRSYLLLAPDFRGWSGRPGQVQVVGRSETLGAYALDPLHVRLRE